MNLYLLAGSFLFWSFAAHINEFSPERDMHVCTLYSKWGPIKPCESLESIVHGSEDDDSLHWAIKPSCGTICTLENESVCMKMVSDRPFGKSLVLSEIDDWNSFPEEMKFNIQSVPMGLQIRSRAQPNLFLHVMQDVESGLVMWPESGSDLQVFRRSNVFSLGLYHRMNLPLF